MKFQSRCCQKRKQFIFYNDFVILSTYVEHMHITSVFCCSSNVIYNATSEIRHQFELCKSLYKQHITTNYWLHIVKFNKDNSYLCNFIILIKSAGSAFKLWNYIDLILHSFKFSANVMSF